MRCHVHHPAHALRALLAHYGIEAYVRICGAEPGCVIVSDDTRGIQRS